MFHESAFTVGCDVGTSKQNSRKESTRKFSPRETNSSALFTCCFCKRLCWCWPLLDKNVLSVSSSSHKVVAIIREARHVIKEGKWFALAIHALNFSRFRDAFSTFALSFAFSCVDRTRFNLNHIQQCVTLPSVMLAHTQTSNLPTLLFYYASHGPLELQCVTFC